MNTPRTLLDGLVQVDYGQMYIESGELPDDPYGAAVVGQHNGLCGAGVPGFLLLTTATHTGAVHLRVEAHEATPPFADEWEDVVEAAFAPDGDDVAFVEWGGGRRPLALPRRNYVVRYCGSAMDAARAAIATDEAPPDRYLLQFWPSDQGDVDRVIRGGSDFAAMFRAAVNEG